MAYGDTASLSERQKTTKIAFRDRQLSAAIGQKQLIAAYKMKGDSQRPHIVYVRRSDNKRNARGEALKQRGQG